MKDDIYELDELIKALENIKNNGDGALSFPKALYCLALEIKKIKENTKGITTKNGCVRIEA